jgi:hypothetical protein
MDAKCSSKTPVYFQRTTRRCILEDKNVHWIYIYKQIVQNESAYIKNPQLRVRQNVKL